MVNIIMCTSPMLLVVVDIQISQRVRGKITFRVSVVGPWIRFRVPCRRIGRAVVVCDLGRGSARCWSGCQGVLLEAQEEVRRVVNMMHASICVIGAELWPVELHKSTVATGEDE
jgi:hypothetical protein